MNQNENSSPENRQRLDDAAAEETVRQDENVSPATAEVPPMENNNETDLTGLNNSQPSAEQMEVHHHAHTPRQKWTHYFWEFFMLFLAVTGGFAAENLREHFIEGHRAKQYASFLYDDLVKDTVNLNDRTAFMIAGNKALDTLIALLQSFEDKESVTAKIYMLSAYVYSGAFFNATTSTVEQLKSSGSLRYFQSNDLIRFFSRYDTDLQRLKAVEDRNVYLNEETRKFLAQFLDLKSISRFTVNSASDSAGFKLTSPAVSGPLRLYQKRREELELYANWCALKQLDWDTRIGLQTRLLASARTLIVSLKKEYDLK